MLLQRKLPHDEKIDDERKEVRVNTMKDKVVCIWHKWKPFFCKPWAVRLGCLSMGAIAALGVAVSIVVSAGAGEQDGVMFDGELIRFHVLANSDSEADQALKLRVRDRILEETCLPLEEAQNTTEAVAQIQKHMADIREVALKEIQSQGYDYPVSVQLGVFDFPVRQYGNVTLPAGRYPALRVVIGEGAGHNWWCVMFPPLCFVEESTQDMPAESLNKISAKTRAAITNVAAEEETEDGAVTSQDGRPKFEIRFKLLEWLRLD